MNLKSFISTELLIAGISLLLAGGAAYADLKSKDARMATKIEEQEKLQSERYADLKRGQEGIQDLLQQMMRDHIPRRD